GNQALALLANSLATGCGLIAIILLFGPLSGAHFNPLVSLTALWLGELEWHGALLYLSAQCTGAIVGVLLAHAMFDLPLWSASQHIRTGAAQWISEVVATFGLIGVIIGCSRTRPTCTPFAVAAYISAAYWFTASTCFANPAVTLARAISDTFAGIRPVDVGPFIAAQALGAVAAALLFNWLYPARSISSKEL
ncbi:MAG: aquaporin, partial [Pseudomonadota bacterium]|nr:aquaporin [Pseudomonadota bacterium]